MIPSVFDPNESWTYNSLSSFFNAAPGFQGDLPDLITRDPCACWRFIDNIYPGYSIGSILGTQTNIGDDPGYFNNVALSSNN